MKILGIETSCDETAVAVLEVKNKKVKVLSNVVSSQIKIHSPFGGVVPSLAAREHEKNLKPVFKKSLKEANTKMGKIDLIAITTGPGLEVALWKGINFAKTLVQSFKKPIIAVNHLEGHIYSNWLPPITKNSKSQTPNHKQIPNSKIQILNKKIFPALNLIVSGGHTQLVLMTGHGKFKIIGETQDDAAGEAFDKVSKMMKLGYPGGPIVSKLAKKGNQKKFQFPRPMLNQKNYNFSFSGLKTAVLYLLKEIDVLRSDSIIKRKLKIKQNIAASFQQAVIDVLVTKTIKAAKEHKVKSILLSGGVSANKLLRKTLQKETKKLGLFYSQPEFQYTGDNAAMIALAGFYKKLKSKNTYSPLVRPNREKSKIEANPNLKIKNWTEV